MDVILLSVSYIKWHYSRALSDILSIWSNMILFFYNFFSVELMTRTLFSKWRRMGEERSTTALDIGEILSIFVVNTVMRVIGALMRGFLIIIGFSAMLITLVLGVVVFVLWFFLPLALIVVIAAGVFLIFLK